MCNKRSKINTNLVRGLPEEVRTWILEERATHIPYFDIRNRPKRVVYDPKVWLRKFRKEFTLSLTELVKKSRKVKITRGI